MYRTVIEAAESGTAVHREFSTNPDVADWKRVDTETDGTTEHAARLLDCAKLIPEGNGAFIAPGSKSGRA